jgi:hypothetical protein
MLQELSVSQNEEGVFRRWFQDDYFHLIVWYEADTNEIRGFQLCYDVSKAERSLTWLSEKGFFHNAVDEGSRPMRHPSSPLLVEDGAFPAQSVIDRFIETRGSIDENIARLVVEKIIEFGRLPMDPEDMLKGKKHT